MTLEAMRSALASGDEETRYRVLVDAERFDRDREVLDLLVGCLGDPSWRVRKAAVDRLVGHAARREALSRLTAALGDDENAGRRNAAAEALVRLGSEAIPAVAILLDDPDRDVRKFAVDVLGEIGDRRAVPALVDRLTDGDENVRGAAAEALGKLSGPEAEAALVAALESGDLLVTLSALDALARAGAVVPLARLAPLLERRLVRRPVLRLLARLDDPPALVALVEGLSDPSRGTREAALAAVAEWVSWHDPERRRLSDALRGSDPTPLTTVCTAALEGRDEAVMAGAVEVLACLGAGEMVPSMVEAGEVEALRDRVQSALVRMGEAVVEPLLAALDLLPPSSQELAVQILAALGDPRAVSELVGRLGRGEPDVRLAAVEALGLLGDARAVEPLARHLGRDDRILSHAVIRSLATLAESAREAVLEACRALLGHDDALRVADACRVLAEVGSPAEIPLLQAVLRHEDARAREAAVDALGLLPSREAVDYLRFALADESPQVRAAAARALGRQHHEAAADALLIALGDDEPSVVGAAAEAIGALGRVDYASHLLPLVGDAAMPGPAAAAYAAVRALGMLNAPELPQALYRAAVHPEGEVAKEAAEVAAALEGEAGTMVLLACARHAAWDVRRAAVRQLARRGERSVVAELRALLAEEDDALAAEGIAEAIRVLEET